MRIKLFFTFESVETAISLAFELLMNFPVLCCRNELYFPRHYLIVLLQQLPLDS